MDWFLYDIGLRHEKVKIILYNWIENKYSKEHLITELITLSIHVAKYSWMESLNTYSFKVFEEFFLKNVHGHFWILRPACCTVLYVFRQTKRNF